MILFFLFLSTTFSTLAQSMVPEVKIRVAQYKNNLEFELPKGGRWLSYNRSGAIPAKTKCKIIGTINSKAVKKFHLMVGSARVQDQAKLNETVTRFLQMGFKTHSFIVGKEPEPGFPDNRMVFIGTGIFFEEEDAKKELDKMSARNISSWVFTEVIEPAKGSFKLIVDGKTLPHNFTDIMLEGKNGVKLLKAEYAKGYSWHGFADRTYRSSVQVRFGADDMIDCIEHTDLESLLVGIVPSEISAKAPKGALQAQAVAARGEMLSKTGTRHFNHGYDFCSEQHCQVYKGMQSCDDQIYNSIKSTRGIILLGSDGAALDAVYSANCGGHSSANQNIWTSNANPHLQGISDRIDGKSIDLTDEKIVRDYILNPPNCWCGIQGVEGANKFRWRKTISGNAWKKVETELGIGRIKSLNEFTRDVSGRIIKIKMAGKAGEKTVMKELSIRRLFGNLKSSCFIVDLKKDADGFIVSATFQGAGWGHGVGMCQTGAQSMAYKGKTFEEILRHYFPGAQLKKLY
jgi:SpoIID/LytB domain protein